jgi:hypothetical protein
MDVKSTFLNEDLNEKVYMEPLEGFILPENEKIFSTDMIGIVETKRYLTFIFKMKDLNEVDIILSIKVKKHSSGYTLN